MKKTLAILTFLLALVSSVGAQSDGIIVRLDATTHGTILQFGDDPLLIRDDDSWGPGSPTAGSPSAGKDYYMTVEASCEVGSRLNILVEELSIHCLDTLYIYNGPDTNGTLIAKFNSNTGNVHEGDYLYESPSNTTGMITIRFRTDGLLDPNRYNLPCYVNRGTVGLGFAVSIHCTRPCETVVPVIDSVFYRTRDSIVYDSSAIRWVTQYRRNYAVQGDTTSELLGIDTIEFWGAHLCIGDGVIFRGHGEYSNRYGYYTPTDETTEFLWHFGNEADSAIGNNLKEVYYDQYQRPGCFTLTLHMTDIFGCISTIYTAVRVRTSLNPIKTIYTLEQICNTDSLLVKMGYDASEGNLILRRVESDSMVSKTNEVRTFIPDGCSCGSPTYYEAPVEFTEFPSGKKVTSAKDICSICINMEHSFMGDFFLTIVCPTGQEAIMKFGNKSIGGCDLPSPSESTTPGGSYGSGTFLGFPLDSSPWDISPVCDSTRNPYGIGLDYCFSRDTNYTLVTGQNAAAVWSAANPHPAGDFYIASTSYVVNLPVSFPAIPAGFQQAGQTPTMTNLSTKKPSDHENKTDYYLPWSSFDELIGCPLNGLWKVRVYDTWGADNGWIFNWSLDICNVSMVDADCSYEVEIDSLVWTVDPSHGDYDLGRYRGLQIRQETPVISYISSPDTAGVFPVNVKLYDDFGCVWDTTTTITTLWTPEPNLIARDTTLCGVDTIVLDAKDRHAATENYAYAWLPNGETSDTISTVSDATADIRYVVEVQNRTPYKTCKARDTIDVHLRKQPFPSIYPSPFNLEGCAPLTLHFENRSVDAIKHRWDFGDGNFSEQESPSHTYDVGTYTLKYYAASDEQCQDSIIATSSITVYPSPTAAFMWEPAYPSAINPAVQFTNLSSPLTDDVRFEWNMQYSQEHPLSVHTMHDIHPLFDYTQYNTGNVAGSYAVTLIAISDNLPPSGRPLACADTVTNTVLVINDFLQFPNVVTPNGDGINDRFVIGNLVDGIAYPVNQLDIYNKWGTRVYHKENISNDADFWDPADMPAGTYFYRFSAKGYNGDVEHNGAIEVIK